jgi:hypothetical protein
MMDINSGFKAVDKLVKTHGVSCEHIDNPFQLAVDFPVAADPGQLRNLIQPFGLQAFPHAMWLALRANISKGNRLSLHRFSLPHMNKVFCWVLINAHGQVVEKAFPMNKPQYVNAARVLIRSLLVGLSHYDESSQNPLQTAA